MLFVYSPMMVLMPLLLLPLMMIMMSVVGGIVVVFVLAVVGGSSSISSGFFFADHSRASWISLWLLICQPSLTWCTYWRQFIYFYSPLAGVLVEQDAQADNNSLYSCPLYLLLLLNAAAPIGRLCLGAAATSATDHTLGSLLKDTRR